MVYGMLATGSCILTDVVDQLHENSKKVNVVERLCRHLALGTPTPSLKAYLKWIRKTGPDEPVILIDDTDIVKPNGRKFEALGIVRDGSESSSDNSVYKKGYLVTEAIALTKKRTSISAFSKIHSLVKRFL